MPLWSATDPDLVALCAAAVAAPEDDTPRLVMADWLQDRDDPRARLLRVGPAVRAAWRDCSAPARRLAWHLESLPGLDRAFPDGRRAAAPAARLLACHAVQVALPAYATSDLRENVVSPAVHQAFLRVLVVFELYSCGLLTHRDRDDWAARELQSSGRVFRTDAVDKFYGEAVHAAYVRYVYQAFYPPAARLRGAVRLARAGTGSCYVNVTEMLEILLVFQAGSPCHGSPALARGKSLAMFEAWKAHDAVGAWAEVRRAYHAGLAAAPPRSDGEKRHRVACGLACDHVRVDGSSAWGSTSIFGWSLDDVITAGGPPAAARRVAACQLCGKEPTNHLMRPDR